MSTRFLWMILILFLMAPGPAAAGDCGYESLPLPDVCWCCNLFFGCFIEGYENNGGAGCFIGPDTSYCVDYGVQEVEACSLSSCPDLGYLGRGFAYRHIAYHYDNVPFCGGGAQNDEPCIMPDDFDFTIEEPVRADFDLTPAPNMSFPIETALARIGE